jgi:UDP-2-acetamido-3-amino-2,3-dideoxy-glucuronate N-acetyltransferase
MPPLSNCKNSLPLVPLAAFAMFRANRLAMGRIRNTESVLFDLCPHDLSLILALIGSLPTKIHCAGASHMTPNIVDFLTSFMGFENGVSAGMQTSWLSPFKEHRLTVTGTAGSLVFDDTKALAGKIDPVSGSNAVEW